MRIRLGIALLIACAELMAQSGGPSILSRGGSSGNRGGRDPLFFRFYADLGFSYETGISPISVDAAGKGVNQETYGAQLSLGAYVRRSFRRTDLNLDYRGDLRHYNNSYYDASDHYLNLTVARQFTKRFAAGLQELAGTLSRSNSGYIISQLSDPSYIGVPINELFDNRSYFLQSSAQAEYQYSQRLSFQVTGAGFLVRRRSKLLYGAQGYQAAGTAQYRLNKSTALVAMYTHMHFDFERAFGGSDVNGYAGGFSHRLSRALQLNVMGGAYRIETLGSQFVPFDPAIQELTGRPGGYQAFHDIRTAPLVQASIVRQWAKSSLGLSYDQMVNPGNGIYLTSTQRAFMANFSHTAAKRWNFGLSGGYYDSNAVVENNTQYGSGMFGGGATYKINDMLHLNTRVDWRHYFVDDSRFSRNSMRMFVSLGFSPGDLPLTLW